MGIPFKDVNVYRRVGRDDFEAESFKLREFGGFGGGKC